MGQGRGEEGKEEVKKATFPTLLTMIVDSTGGTAERKALVKLRISNHKLMIEQGKYNQISRENRHCPLCGSNQIENETHFLFHCFKYSIIRNNFYYKVQSLIPNITQLHVNDLINELMKLLY